ADLVALRVHGPKIVTHTPVVRLRRQHQIELRGGALGIALLEVDEADLRAGLARIRVDALELLELRERLVEFLLPDVETAQPAAYDRALGIQDEDALVELDGLVGMPLH